MRFDDALLCFVGEPFCDDAVRGRPGRVPWRCSAVGGRRRSRQRIWARTRTDTSIRSPPIFHSVLADGACCCGGPRAPNATFKPGQHQVPVEGVDVGIADQDAVAVGSSISSRTRVGDLHHVPVVAVGVEHRDEDVELVDRSGRSSGRTGRWWAAIEIVAGSRLSPVRGRIRRSLADSDAHAQPVGVRRRWRWWCLSGRC